MVSFGSKALQSQKHKTRSLSEEEEEEYPRMGGSRKNSEQNRRPRKDHVISKTNQHASSFHQSQPAPSVIRKQVDPETTKYFSEISNIFEGAGVDIDERTVICGNALEETRGKELELATDYIISHTLQSLLEGCDVHQLCGFLRSCSNVFPSIAMDRSGSHVAESALRALAVHLQDSDAYDVIEEALTKICQVIVLKPVEVMCNSYGSHVLRSLLCLCKGMSLDSSKEFHTTKASTILAERFNTKETKYGGNSPTHLQNGFPDLLKFLVKGMIDSAQKQIRTILADQYSSLVLQAALKLLVGEDEELMHIIPILLGCKGEDTEGTLLKPVRGMLDLLNDNAYSHLMEVILDVAPDSLYDEILKNIFKNKLFEISSHHCGSFVIQALVSSARCQDHMDLILNELGGKFKELFESGRSGVVASILAASQKLNTNERKCSEALAAAVCSATEPSNCIVPRILHLENYFCCEDRSNWKWGKGDKMHVLGCLMLQTIFKYQSEFIQPYVTSFRSMEPDQVLETAKDAGGGRVVECFLSSNVSAKQKHKFIVKLRGHFGELSMRPSGSFTIEKCFTASNLSLRETIASELLAVRSELYKTKQGPHLLRKLDIDGYATRRDEWKSRQETKQAVYKAFYEAFGSSKTTKNESSLGKHSSSRSSPPPHSVKRMRKEIDEYLAPSGKDFRDSNFLGLNSSMAKLGFSGSKRSWAGADNEQGGKKFKKLSEDSKISKRGNKEGRNKKMKAAS